MLSVLMHARLMCVLYFNKLIDWLIGTEHGRVSLYFTMGRPLSPQNCPFARGDLDPPNAWFLVPESKIQTASRSVQPFFAGLTIVTDRQTTLLHL